MAPGWTLFSVVCCGKPSSPARSSPAATTSGYTASTLGLYALTAVAQIAAGSPLCRVHANDAAFAGLEIALKGGQVGKPDFFSAVRQGGAN
ncbi:MAG: hypothetical protein JO283_05605 [Bradyrhizobium sp.]|nr:hypothetical protein [Bradyrhizobium sp.]